MKSLSKLLTNLLTDLKNFLFNNKQIVWVVLCFLLIVLFWKRIKNFLGIRSKANSYVDEEIKKEDTSGASITDQQAEAYASKLYDAMDKFGTDTETIFGILGKLTLADYNKIYNVFGKRNYNSWFGFSNLKVFGSNLSLTEWLINELDNREYQELKRKNSALPL